MDSSVGVAAIAERDATDKTRMASWFFMVDKVVVGVVTPSA